MAGGNKHGTQLITASATILKAGAPITVYGVELISGAGGGSVLRLRNGPITLQTVILPVGNTGNFAQVTIDSNYALDVVAVGSGPGTGSVILPVGNTGNFAQVTLDNDYTLDVQAVGSGPSTGSVILPVGTTGNFAQLTLDNDYTLDVQPASNGTVYIQETGTPSNGAEFDYGEGFYFPAGCYASVDGNIVSALISCDQL